MIENIKKIIPGSLKAVFITLKISVSLCILLFFVPENRFAQISILCFVGFLTALSILANTFEGKEHCEDFAKNTKSFYRCIFDIFIVIIASILQYAILYTVSYFVVPSFFEGLDNIDIPKLLVEMYFYSFDNMFGSDLSIISTNSTTIKFIASTEVILGFLFLSLMISDIMSFGKKNTQL